MTEARHVEHAVAPGRRSGAGRRRRRLAVAVATLVALTGAGALLPGGPIAGATGSAAGQGGTEGYEIEIEAGLGGVTPSGVPVPVRILLTSPQPRTVTAEVRWEGGRRSVEIELTVPTTSLDVSLPPTSWVQVIVRDGPETIRDEVLHLTPDTEVTVVGIGAALAAAGAPASSPTIGAVQQAVLVTLYDDLWTRAGALTALSGIVLSAADLDALDPERRDRLREWVWDGGDLAIDVPVADDLPVLDLPAAGANTAVGAGWVRFTSGAAAAGAWSTLLEPAVSRVDHGMDTYGQGAFSDTGWEHLGLVTVGFLPTPLVAVSVLGTALMAGPLAWFLLRSRRRRQWMWLIAPGVSLVVAGALLVAGQSVFARAETRVIANLRSSPWSTSGKVLSGLKHSADVAPGPDAELLGSTPIAFVTGSGGDRSAHIELPRNGFGAVGVEGAVSDGGPRLEVTAVATPDGAAEVQVTNRSNATLTNVFVTANGISRALPDVAPDATTTSPFDLGADIPLWGPVFPNDGSGALGDISRALSSEVGPPQSRGLVRVTGVLLDDLTTMGLDGAARIAIESIVPVTGPDASAASLRVDQLGGMSALQLEDVRAKQRQFSDGVTSALPGPAEYARLSFPGGRASAPCAVNTSAPQLSAWDGATWVALEKTGTPFIDPMIVGVDGQGSEMQEWLLPAVEPGGRLHLRIDGRLWLTPVALMFDCGARS